MNNQSIPEKLTFWTELPRGSIVEEAQNTAPSLEGALRRRWATKPGRGPGWREGLVAGNGRMGLVVGGAPEDEALIYQNIDFVIPSGHPRFTPPEVGGQLEAARQSVLNRDDGWMIDGRRKTTVYSFHPGEQLRVRRRLGEVRRYERQTDVNRGELNSFVETEEGVWTQRHFASLTDDVIVSEYFAPEGSKGLDLIISPDLPEEMEGYGYWMHGVAPETLLCYRLFASEDCGSIGILAHYPAFKGSELAESGYLVVSRILREGGAGKLKWDPVKTRHMVNAEGRPVIEANGLRRLQVVTRAVPVDGLGMPEDFIAAGASGILKDNASFDRCIWRELKRIDGVIAKYADASTGLMAYERAISGHARCHAEAQRRFSLTLSEDDGAADLSFPELLERQKGMKTLSGALIERLTRIGRYAMFSCAGHSAPRLYGMWTGEWNPAWSGAYTMDANVNLQVSGMNTGNMPEVALGYCRFVWKQLDDWRENARHVYGMTDALMVPVNTDGRRAMLVEYDSEYPFQYWNAGATWMAAPIFEFWQCFGDQTLQWEDIPAQGLVEGLLRPLLRRTLNFWMQLCNPEYYMSRDGIPSYHPGKRTLESGERYLLIPTYSPENHPLGCEQSLTMNASMDISAARDCVRMARELETCVPVTGNAARGSVEAWSSAQVLTLCDRLEHGLPKYLMDESGALKEWACEGYRENNAHRHLSHLYCAWPGLETHNDHTLARASVQAVENRNRENEGKDDTPSHGWIHKLLILARLRQENEVGELLRRLLSSNVFYATGMTDHNIDRCRAVFCTDTLFGLQGVIQEMLVYSDASQIEVLPALPAELERGQVCGVQTRCRVQIEKLQWDFQADRIEITFLPEKDVTLELNYRANWIKSVWRILKSGELKPVNEVDRFQAGEHYCVIWERGES